MWRCPPASGTPFITRPRAKKKPRGPTEESRPKQNLLVYPRTPPHRQVNAILPAASSTLERASELIDAKVLEDGDIAIAFLNISSASTGRLKSNNISPKMHNNMDCSGSISIDLRNSCSA